jgi:hypothetical protein
MTAVASEGVPVTQYRPRQRLVSRRVRPHLVRIWVNIKAIAIPRAARQALA